MRAGGLRSIGLAEVLLCLISLAGCGSSDARFQRIAYCQGPSSDLTDDGFLDVEFRQGATVVAQGSVDVGTVFLAEVPIGRVQIYVDGVRVGAMNEGVDMADDVVPPAPGEADYLAGEGCPEDPLP